MPNQIIVLQSDFNIGDIVSRRVQNSEDHSIQLIVTGYIIHAIDEAGQVIHHSLLCSDGVGNIVDFKSYELKKEEINN